MRSFWILFLPIILAAYFLLQTATPVYADHCVPRPGEDPDLGNKMAGGTYCFPNPAGVDEIWMDLDCSLAQTHRFTGIRCKTDEECVKGDPLFGNARQAHCEPRGTVRAPTSANDAAGLQQIEDVFRNVISAVVGLAFIISLVMLVLAGIKYLTSGGEPKAIQAAHQTVTWALLGILFMAIAWIVLQLIHTFTGIDVTIFNIKALCNVGGDWCKP